VKCPLQQNPLELAVAVLLNFASPLEPFVHHGIKLSAHTAEFLALHLARVTHADTSAKATLPFDLESPNFHGPCVCVTSRIAIAI
jgi:hypothetical protein